MTPDFLKKGAERRVLGEPWKILVVDDEPDIHAITSIIAKDIVFEGRPVKVYSAYSAVEAIEILNHVQDMALALIDVVMEKDDSGLRLVKYIREDLGNYLMRLVIRTGQPGYAPPKEIVLKYDINDYREKAELSSNALFTMIVSKLREYKHILMLDTQKKLLERLNFYASRISRFLGSSNTFESTAHIDLITEILDNISLIMGNNFSLKYDLKTLSGESAYNDTVKHFRWTDDSGIELKFKSKIREFTTVNVYFTKTFDELYKGIIEAFFERFSLAIENNLLTQDLIDAFYKIVYVISNVIETRSFETGEHIRRMEKVAALMGKFFGYSEEFSNVFGIAAMLHDVGKIGIPDNILNKPGKLSQEEFEIIKKHTIIGFNILSAIEHPIFELASSVALNHHENWDGSGYPYGLKGEEIPIEARIVSLIDVFDALLSDRIYRPAWKEEDVVNYIKQNTGIKFDPNVVKVFFNNYDYVRQIYFS
ncbi:MAG: HD domain-containing phosphohydrolase [Fervidobacterium sp.]